MGTTPSTRPPETTAAQLKSRCSTTSGMPTTAIAATSVDASTTVASAVQAAFEQRALVEQVVAGVGRQAQLGKRHQHRAAGGGLAVEAHRLGGVEGRVGDAVHRHGDGDAGEAVGVGVEEAVEGQRAFAMRRR